MATYQTFTTCGDMGPWVSKLILELPEVMRETEVSAAAFSVYVERLDREKGGIALVSEQFGAPATIPSRGYVPVTSAYVCNEAGSPVAKGGCVALELPECKLTKRIDGALFRSYIRTMGFRVMQIAALPVEESGRPPLVGLVWDECTGDLCPQLDGWHLDGLGTFAGIELSYAWYEPNVAAVNAFRALPGFFHADPLPERLPLVLWLHGAGEGQEPYRTVCGNKCVALGEADIQGRLGGAAWVLAPSSPTFWMDPDGRDDIVDDNQSLYTRAIKALVDDFVAEHAEVIDIDRIYVGGLSNGGFMTCRLIVNYPDFFAAAVPVCAPWVADLASDEEFAAMAQTPTWWVQSDDDPIVPVDSHFKPSWKRLLAAGAQDVHATYYDHVADSAGNRLVGHFAWVPVYNDLCRTDLDGSFVCGKDGFPVTLWQWVGQHQLG